MIPSTKKINTQKQTNFDIVVIGGGVVGLASAYKIQINYFAAEHFQSLT
jgi:glycerol-3-phosphate dehydrogenase